MTHFSMHIEPLRPLRPLPVGALPQAAPGTNVPPPATSVAVPVAELVGVSVIIVILLVLLLLLLARRGGNSRSSASHRNVAPIVHFVPGEIGLIVEHPHGVTSQQLVESVARDPLVASAGDLSSALVRSSRVTTLSQGRSQAVSLLVATVQGANQAGLLKLVNGLTRQLASGANRPSGAAGGGASGVTILAVSPNWLASGCPAQGGGVGGPGGTPVAPATPPTDTAWRLNLPPSLVAAGGDGDGVHIAILDTAPCDADLANAYATWGSTALGNAVPQHPLIASLLRPHGPLNVYHAGGAHLLQTVDYHLDAHHYPMPDHGLFIAGIVHSLAPRARIHLIEALNTYGVGTLETFAQAFRAVQLLAEGRDPGRFVAGSTADVDSLAASARGSVPVVLNCSFMFNVAANSSLDDPQLKQDAELSTAMGAFPNVWQALIGNEHVPIVAAAGNDRTVAQFSHGAFPAERYPAAFTDVIGVGALDSHGTPTMYTDLAHVSTAGGLAVFGGDVSPASGPDAPSAYVADANRGMLGIFVGPRYPDGTLNRTGWARWAGTSFSAPIVTGIIARSLGGAPLAEFDAHALHDHVLAPLVAASAAETPVGKSLSVTQG